MLLFVRDLTGAVPDLACNCQSVCTEYALSTTTAAEQSGSSILANNSGYSSGYSTLFLAHYRADGQITECSGRGSAKGQCTNLLLSRASEPANDGWILVNDGPQKKTVMLASTHAGTMYWQAMHGEIRLPKVVSSHDTSGECTYISRLPNIPSQLRTAAKALSTLRRLVDYLDLWCLFAGLFALNGSKFPCPRACPRDECPNLGEEGSG